MCDFSPKVSNPKYPWFLLLYEVIVLGFWVVLIISNRNKIYSTYPMDGVWSLDISIPVAVVVGSISATSFALYGMYKHMIDQDFGKNYIAWYISKPVVGGVMGGFIGIIFTVLISSLGSDTVTSHAAFIGVTFLAGSNERFTASMIEKFTNKILGVGDSEKKQKTGNVDDSDKIQETN